MGPLHQNPLVAKTQLYNIFCNIHLYRAFVVWTKHRVLVKLLPFLMQQRVLHKLHRRPAFCVLVSIEGSLVFYLVSFLVCLCQYIINTRTCETLLVLFSIIRNTFRVTIVQGICTIVAFNRRCCMFRGNDGCQGNRATKKLACYHNHILKSGLITIHSNLLNKGITLNFEHFCMISVVGNV